MNAGHGEGRRGEGQLYVVATPIGNLEDITLRALKVLAEADVIAAEDTRHTGALLARHGVGKRPVTLHEHNEAKMAGQGIGWLREGLNVALVSDAGTPGLSDPGAVVVAKARAAGLRVVPIPGANAAVAAFCASGLSNARFLFVGFLPARRAARRAELARLARLPYALVFYEAPHRVIECVDDLAGCLPGERTIVFARELTKMFESVDSLPLAQAAAWLRDGANRQRGEFVLIVSGAEPEAARAEWEPVLERLLAELPLAQAVRLTCAVTGARRKPVYERSLAMAGDRSRK